jgi:hypothetical protein
MLSVGDNSTAIMTALPTMTRDLKLGSAAIEWMVNTYLLAAAVFILAGGEAAHWFGLIHREESESLTTAIVSPRFDTHKCTWQFAIGRYL